MNKFTEKQKEIYSRLLNTIKDDDNYKEYSKNECIYFAHGWLSASLERGHITYKDYYQMMDYILFGEIKKDLEENEQS